MSPWLNAAIPSHQRAMASDAAIGKAAGKAFDYLNTHTPEQAGADIAGAVSKAWGNLEADHAKAAAKGPEAEARWLGQVAGRASFEIASFAVPVTKAALIGKAANAAAHTAEAAVDVARAGNAVADGARVADAAGDAGRVAGKEAPYSNLIDSPFVGPGKNFTASQKAKIIKQNLEINGGVLRSDLNGEILLLPKKSVRGIKPPTNEAQIDHMIARKPSNPRAPPGTNSFENAQVLSRAHNREKSNK